MTVREWLGDREVNRRRLALLGVLLLVLLGAGIGTFIGDDGGDDPGPPVVTVTPTSPTPTPPGGGAGTATPTPTPPTGSPTPTEATPTTTPTATPPTGDGGTGGAGGGGGGSDPAVDLEPVGSGVVLNYHNAAPGVGGRETLVLRNAGTQDGRFRITDVSVTDRENGIGPAESPVDDTPNDGELSEHVKVRLEVHSPDGSVDYLYDTDAGTRSLADLAAIEDTDEAGIVGPGEEAEVVVDWHIPASTGNEIQSDAAEFDLGLGLTSVTS